MDPATASARCMARRFPRPRGDGPAEKVLRVLVDTVSPPTRGWTIVDEPNSESMVGFPAHAGMDPHRRKGLSAVRRFPRPRGDGPLSVDVPRRRREVSPPTRGWTLHVTELGRDGHGFPAHAGMDPHRGSRPSPAPWFPRPRGDGPWDRTSVVLASLVSPPTRGWTSSCFSLSRATMGFPAHAGMDPDSDGDSDSSSWFPRPRGDGPVKANSAGSASTVSPPTRGWTSGARPSADPPRGFPAHAGMDHQQCSASRLLLRFPRPRGDGPPFSPGAPDCWMVSPPTRGWTAEISVRGVAACGFPAHAGMDPS